MKKFLKVLFFATVAVALILVGSVFAAPTIAKADGGSQPECFSFSFVKVCVWPLGVETEEVETEIVVEEDAEEVETEESLDIQSNTYFPEYSCSDLNTCPMRLVPEDIFIVAYPHGCETFKVFFPGEILDFNGYAEIHAYAMSITTGPRFNMNLWVPSQFQDVHACYAFPTP
ncbi:hypothetical protein CVU76_03135 [Candidatus Dojkabacteria bacterium HGW-Dojkabacteria-1]|uniref:MD-2-related lipid-recognition domain-containing protein n=1 Tax=Candidatus Dojkabacteria bacterium HGW-Dojkabacteria-1 TaxID=2013761 RepID=A0A2N2F451_9BACT|nr:MAG: hypothetical protein CVU76_03135 [Candidatus Dojkabacteria bacterium HGW-Dojkabacteria-1]